MSIFGQDRDWPEIAPTPDPWAGALAEAAEQARSYFNSRHESAAPKRLPKVLAIAETQNWTRRGDRLDTWLMPSSTRAGVLYQVNGRCTCPDYEHNGVPGGWCKHRLARTLAKRAAEILKTKNETGDALTPPVSASEEAIANCKKDSTTEFGNGQPHRIALIVATLLKQAAAPIAAEGDNPCPLWYTGRTRPFNLGA